MAGIDLMSLGVSALKVAQQALSTTGHNISNVNTASYSRQRVETSTNLAAFTGGGFFGTGVHTDTVTRAYDKFLTQELQSNLSNEAQLSAFSEFASRIDNLLGNNNTGLSTVTQDFFSALHAFADDPTSIPAREVVLTQANILSDRFNTVQRDLSTQRDILNNELSASTAQISAFGRNIAKLNNDIALAKSASGGNIPNDLLDQRDEQLTQLSKLVNLTTVEDGSSGMLNVFIGAGQSLVLNNQSAELVAVPRPTDPLQVNIAIQTPNGMVDITSSLTGGRTGGLLAFQTNTLDLTMNSVGRMALAISDSFNTQNALGVDLNAELGQLIFADINSTNNAADRVMTATTNQGSAQLSVTLDDVSGLGISDYSLAFNGTSYNLTRLSDKAVIANFAEPAVPGPIAIAAEGFTLNFSSLGAVAGDQFLIRPTRSAASNIEVVMADPAKLAAASPIHSSSSLTNTGSGTLGSVRVQDTTNAAFATPGQLTPPVLIEFTSQTTFDILDAVTAAPLASNVSFTPNQDNDPLALAGLDYGYSFTLSGAPAIGDTFSIDYNATGVGDNRNALAITALQTTKTMAAGKNTFQESYTQLVANVGTRSKEVKTNAATASSLLQQAQQRRDNVVGVNLDEEAANMLRFEQAYQAAARIISTSQTIFDSLLRAVGG